MYVWYQEWFLKKTVIRPRQKIKHWRKKIQILKNKQQKQTNKKPLKYHRPDTGSFISSVPLPKHFVKVPSLLHYVLKLLRTIALQSQLTKNNQPTWQLSYTEKHLEYELQILNPEHAIQEVICC